MNNLTVYILSCDRPDLLHNNIKQLAKLPSLQKIKVMDNSSNPEKIHNLARLYPNIEFHINGERLTYTKNLSRCIKNCDTKYMLCLHDDDLLLPLITKQMKYFTDDTILAVAGNGFFYDILSKKKNRLIVGKPLPSKIETIFQYAKIKYQLRGGCIPFSPIIFRTHYLKEIEPDLRLMEKLYQQSIDVAIIISMLADGVIAYNHQPVYLCGVHKNQDSRNMTRSREENIRKLFVLNLTFLQNINFYMRLTMLDLTTKLSLLKKRIIGL